MTQSTDEIPLFPAAAPAVLADAAESRRLLGAVLADLADVVGRVGAAGPADDLTRPTPCRDYDVAALRDHVLGWVDFFGAAFADPQRQAERPDPAAFRAADHPDADHAGVVRNAAERLDRALADGVLDGDVVLSQSRMHGPAALGMVLGEYVVHGWDLARAVGAPWSPPEEAAATALEFFRGVVVPEYRGADGGFFDAEVPVPDGAPALDRLLGFAGRDPGWTPPAR